MHIIVLYLSLKFTGIEIHAPTFLPFCLATSNLVFLIASIAESFNSDVNPFKIVVSETLPFSFIKADTTTIPSNLSSSAILGYFGLIALIGFGGSS